jgi:transaldolase
MSNPQNSLFALRELGQAIWLDGIINRQMLTDGTLEHLIRAYELTGLNTNLTTFKKTIEQDKSYQIAIKDGIREGKSATEIYERLIIEDIRTAADHLHSLYDQTKGQDGFVSLEISPLLAHDTEATINESRRLWQQVNRPNAMIAIFGTKAGLTAVEQLIGEGININITLLFSVGRYLEAANAYMVGLERRLAVGQSINRIASVASFFINPIDLMVDSVLNKIAEENNQQRAKIAGRLRGKVAIASAGFAYERFKELYAKLRWKHSAAQGGRKQRLLWAVTASETPFHSDVRYVDSLVGPETVTAIPITTLKAYCEHGRPEARIPAAVQEAPEIMHQLTALGVDLRLIDEQLEAEGIQQLIVSYNHLLAHLEQHRTQIQESAFS